MRLTRALVDAAATLAVDRTTADVLAAFATEHVPSLLLKGPSLAWLYPAEARRYGDTDLLVPPTHFATAEAALERLGFQQHSAESAPPEPSRNEVVYVRVNSEDGDAWVDLHRSLAFATVPAEIVWAALSAELRPAMVAGQETAILGTTASALLLSLHAAQHPREPTGKLEDLRRGIDRLPVSDWLGALNLADQLKCRKAFLLGLWTVDQGRALGRLLGTSRPDVALSETPPELLPPLVRVYLSTMRCTSRREQAVFVGGRLFPSRACMRSRFAMARGGRMGLVASYAIRLASAPREVLYSARYLLGRRRCG